MSLMAASLLLPTATLASSVRPGSRVTHKSLNAGSPSRSKSPLCLSEKERFTEKCDIVIDETGVTGPVGHITNVVQWIKEEKEFSYGGAVAGGVAGAGVGMAAGLGSCMIVGPLCLLFIIHLTLSLVNLFYTCITSPYMKHDRFLHRFYHLLTRFQVLIMKGIVLSNGISNVIKVSP